MQRIMVARHNGLLWQLLSSHPSMSVAHYTWARHASMVLIYLSLDVHMPGHCMFTLVDRPYIGAAAQCY